MYGQSQWLMSFGFKQFFNLMSTWLMVLISIDRLVHIVHPLWVMKFSKPRRLAVFIVIGTSLVAFITISVIIIYLWKISEIRSEKLVNVTFSEKEISRNRKILERNNTRFKILYAAANKLQENAVNFSWKVIVCFGSFIPVCVLVLPINILLICVLVYKSRQRKRLTNATERKGFVSKGTKMILTTISVFTLLQLPFPISYLITTIEQ